MRRNIVKKRAATLLAAVMAFTIPLNNVSVFAQPAATPAVIAPMNFSVGTGVVANTRLSRATINAPMRSAFIESGARSGTSGAITGSNLIENWIEGSNLHVIFNEAITNATLPIEFTLELENAVWFFRNSGSADTGNLGSATFNPANGNWNEATSTYTRTVGNIQYRLQVSQANPSRATVTLINTTGIVPAFNKFRKNNQETPQNNTEQNVQPESQAPEKQKEKQVEPASTTPEKPKPAEIIKPAAAPKNEKTTPEQAPAKGPQSNRTILVDAMTIIDDLAREAQISGRNNSDVNDTPAYNAHNAVIAAKRYVEHAQDVALYSNKRENIQNAISRVDFARSLGITTTTTDLNEAYNELNAAYTLLGTSTTPDNTLPEVPDVDEGEENVIVEPENTLPEVKLPAPTNPTAPTPPNGGSNPNQNNQRRGDLAIPVSSYAVVNPISNENVTAHLSSAHTALTRVAETLEIIIQDEIGNGAGNGNAGPGYETGVSIASGAQAVIPLAIRSLGNDGDVTVRVAESSLIPMQTHTLAIARGVAEGATRIVTRAVAIGRDRIELEPIGIFENRAGALPASGTFEFVAPSGFHFASTANVRVIPEGGVHSNNFTATASIVANSDARIVRIQYSGLLPSTTLTGQLAVTNLVLLNSNVNGDNIREGEISMQIRNVSGQPSVVSPQTFAVAQVTDWRINLTRIGEAPTLINGRLNGHERNDVSDESHRAARIRVEEIIPNAWWAQRATTLNLPDGVRVRRAEFRNVRNIRNSEVLNGTFHNDRTTAANGNVRISDNQITISGLDVIPDQRASFEIELWLNIESGFEGEIPITLGGSAITGAANAPYVVVANSINPVNVTTEVRNVKMGYEFVSVGNFRIEETRAGALLGGEEVYVSITDENFTELQIGPGFTVRVTEGDIRIGNSRVATHLGFLGRPNQAWRVGANAAFDIERESTIASTIDVTGVQVRVSPVMPVPTTGSDFNLVIWGPAVAANYEGIRDIDNERVNRHDFFNTPGIVERVIIGTGAVGLSNVVRITPGNPILLVNNEQMLMDTSAYISQRSDSLMIPVRFVSMALGLEAGRVLWSPETATVTVDAGERILQFRVNSSVMLINGIEFPMLNASGMPVFTEIRDNRAFIPFRALSEALNVFVEWEPQTATATFDPRREADRTFHAEDLITMTPYTMPYQNGNYPYHNYQNGNYNRIVGTIR